METDKGVSSVEHSATTPLLSSEGGKAIETKNNNKKQIFIGVVAALPSIAPGICLGFSAVALPQLNFNLDDSSWFASIIALAIPVGALLSGLLMDKFGRRPALLTVSVVGFLGWLMLTYQPTAPTLAKLYTGRILTGISTGLATIPAATYASETLKLDNSELQTSIITWSTVGLGLGILIVYITGSLIPYYQVAGFATVLSIVSFVAVAIFLPESPYWLQSKGRHGDADWVFSKLGVTPKPNNETQPQADTSSQPSTSTSVAQTETLSKESFKETLNELKKPEAYKPLSILIFFFLFQQFSGVYVIIMYMVDIIRMAGVVGINPYFVTVLSGTIILCVSIFATFSFPKTGARAIAAISGLGMATSMFFIAVYLSLRPYFLTRLEYYYLRWIPLLVILFTVTSNAVSFLILPWSVLTHVFPLSVKGTLLAIATTVGCLFSFIVIKIFPYLWLSLGNNGIFYFFAIMSLLSILFAYFFLPETNGKSLDEIIERFSKTKNK